MIKQVKGVDEVSKLIREKKDNLTVSFPGNPQWQITKYRSENAKKDKNSRPLKILVEYFSGVQNALCVITRGICF
ncbi:MAG: hypothetical protein V9F01_17190 [Chitinophagaceae bacterium]